MSDFDLLRSLCTAGVPSQMAGKIADVVHFNNADVVDLESAGVVHIGLNL